MKANHIIIFSFLLLFAVQGQSQSASQLYKLGKKDASSGNVDLAIAHFNQAIALEPANYDYLIACAKQYDIKRDYEKALLHYTSALALNAKDELVMLHVADINILLNQYNDAIRILKNLLILNDNNFEGLEKMAMCLMRTKQYEEAVRVCHFANNTSKRKNNFYFHYYVAMAKDSLKEYAYACAEYDTTLIIRRYYDKQKTPPVFLKPYYINFALALINDKHYDDAINYCTDALALDPNDSLGPKNVKVYYYRSIAYLYKTNYTNALDDLAHAIVSNPHDKDVIYQRGVVYQTTHQFLNAINDYTKYIQLDDARADAYSNRGLCYLEMGSYKEAVADLRKAVTRVNPANNNGYVKALRDAEKKMYDLNKEGEPPVITVELPIPDKDNFINVLENQYEVLIKGHIKDKSLIEYVKINGVNVVFNVEELNPEFTAFVKLSSDLLNFEITASDVYHNIETKNIKVGHIVSESKSIVSFAGKIVTEDEAHLPYSNKNVYVVDENGAVFMVGKTNEKGYFRFTNLPIDKNYMLKMDVSDSPLAMKQKFIITDESNKPLISSIDEGKQRFKFQIIATDINTLALMSMDDVPLLIDIKGRLFGADDGRKPLVNTTLQLLNEKGEVVATKKTDEIGSFIFAGMLPQENYTLRTDAEETKNLLFNKVVITDEKGKIIKELIRSEGGLFEFKLLPPEKNEMEKMAVSDPWLKTLNLSKEKKEVIIIENIYYTSGSAEVLPEAEAIIQKAIDAMKANAKIKLEVQSHTDAIAGDDYNMELSQKRATTVVAYMVSKGIDKSRLTAKGFGETKLTNRCANGVDCSDAEHKQNRRTVFKINYVGL